MGTTRNYVIEWVEERTWQVLLSVSFSMNEEDLIAIIGAEANDQLRNSSIELTSQQLKVLAQRELIEWLEQHGMPILRSRVHLDERPYVIHTSREVELIVGGTKPLAVFSEWLPTSQLGTSDGEQHLESIYQAFRSSPTFKRLSIRWCCWLGDKPDGSNHSMTLYVARDSEEWRIDAHILMRQCTERTGWNDGFELMEGFLLGYEAWQNEIHLQNKADS